MTRFVLSFTPLLPIPVLWILAALALVVVALGFLGRRRGTTLRALAFALMLVALADPSLVREDRQGLKDVVAVVIDQSGSQTIGDRAAQTARAKSPSRRISPNSAMSSRASSTAAVRTPRTTGRGSSRL